MNHEDLALHTAAANCPKCDKPIKRGPQEVTAIHPPCPRCGRCGFIEDADMNLAGQCPECNGTGRKVPEIAGGSWEEQCMAARELKEIFKAEAESMRRERDELISIAETINEYASGWKPWGGCRCDHGEAGRAQLRGEKFGRCKALDRLREISQHNTLL